MASPQELMSQGMHANIAGVLGADAATTVTAAGSTQATGAALVSGFTEITTASSSTGVVLTGFTSTHVVYNGGSNPVKVYPPVGSYMNGSQNAAFTVTNAKSAIFFRSGNRYIGVLSA